VSKRRFPEGVPVDVAVLQEKFNDVERAIKLIAEARARDSPRDRRAVCGACGFTTDWVRLASVAEKLWNEAKKK
jgi:hypothetical protein